MSAQAISPARQTAIGLAGFLALVVAMGIGRFAFTPMLPLMQRDGAIGISSGSWLAAANYAGYFAGAVTVAYVRLSAKNLILGSLMPIALFTAAMGLFGNMAPWLALRFIAGMLSAWTLVGASVWCLGELAKARRPALAGMVYAGVGAGIAIAGLLCLAFAGTASAASLWQYLGYIAGALTLAVWFLGWQAGPGTGAAAAASPAGAVPGSSKGQRGLIVCYGCFGFGYILPATFIPALGRMVIDDPAVFGWAWPIFGVTAAISTVLTSVLLNQVPRMVLLARSYFIMAIGAGLPALWPSLAAILLSAVCVGGTFMVITMAGFQEARIRAGNNATRLMAQLTAAFAIGQIAGPLFSALLAGGSLFDEKTSLRAGLLVATAVLVISGIWLQRESRPQSMEQGAST
jgi:MFS family permease